jgi:peptide-methionine (S)-S-oxide reductase
MAIATLAGGCFWCLEAVYEHLKGVEQVVSGYMGGHQENPTYQEVCTGNTGHAEVVQITYDESVITYDDLLDVFFTIHDPTTLNRQGADVGTQYRSAIYYYSDAQQDAAQQKIADLSSQALWDNPIVTEVTAAETFYPAEAYHQGYFRNNPTQGYCAAVVAPKVAKFRKQHFERLKA